MLHALRRGLVGAALTLLVSSGCGDGDVTDPAAQRGTGLGGDGTLVYALDGRVQELDPLLATTRPERIVARQAHEPLVELLRGPFAGGRPERGLARSWRHSRDREIWRFELRERVRFQDGRPFNAAAVVANAERWRSRREGRALLPELAAADAPRPDLVRFIFARPVTGVAKRLASPRLGIVSPRALRGARRGTEGAAAIERSGTGAFELRERDADAIVIARNVGWWGARAGLGPALDQVEFRLSPNDRQRLSLLRTGTAQVADALPSQARREIRRDPLLAYVLGPAGDVVGLERSVRGIDSSGAVQPLSQVWLTTVGVE